MRSIRIMSVMLIALCAVTAATAQVPGATNGEIETKETPRIEPVITHIPAGSMGFAAMNCVEDSFARIEAWLTNTGLDEILMDGDAEGRLFEQLMDKSPIGEGFDRSGGVAIVMLDAKKFGIDLPKLIREKAESAPSIAWQQVIVLNGEEVEKEETDSADEKPTTQPEEDIKLPFVIFLPGSDIKEILDSEGMEVTQAGKYKKLKIGGNEMIAGKIGSYIILSPRADALDAVIASKKNALEELGKDKGCLVMDGGIVCHINMTLSAPTINAALKVIKEDYLYGMPSFIYMPMMLFKAMAEMSPFYTYAFSQMETFTFTGKADKTGLLANILVDWKPGSLFAKIYSANKGKAGELINQVPNFGFLFAMGATLERGKEAEEITLKRVDALLANEHVSPHVSKKTKARARKLALDIHKQVDRWQFVVGSPPEDGDGMMGMGIVMHCEDAEKLRKLLSQSANTFEGFIDDIRTEKDYSSAATADETADEEKKEGEKEKEEDPDKVKFTYTRATETCGELKVDTIDIKHKSLEQFAGMTPSPLTMYIGEDRLRIRVASPDKNTVVLTFGGSKEMLTETLKTAKAKKPLLTKKLTQEIFKHLPKNCSTVALLNPGSYITMGMKMSGAMMGGGGMTIPDLSDLPPIAFGSAAIGKTKHGVIYVPNELIREIINTFERMRQMQDPEGRIIDDGEDF